MGMHQDSPPLLWLLGMWLSAVTWVAWVVGWMMFAFLELPQTVDAPQDMRGGGFSRLLNLVDATEDVGWAKLGYVNPARRRCLNTADDLTWKLDRPTFWINWHKSCEHKEEVKHIALGAAFFRSNVALVSQFYLEMTWKKTTRPVPPWPCGWPALYFLYATQPKAVRGQIL